jgi:hypothetical protein
MVQFSLNVSTGLACQKWREGLALATPALKNTATSPFPCLQAFPNRVLQLSADMKKVQLEEEIKGETRQTFRSNGESHIGMSSLDETGTGI